MKILLFVSVLAVLSCLGVLVAVIVAAKRREDRDGGAGKGAGQRRGF